MLLILIFVLAALSFAFLVPTRKTNAKSFNPPPGPKGLPILGNLHQLDFSALHVFLAKLAKTYGPVVSLRYASKPVVVVQSAKMAKEILKTQDLNFCNREHATVNKKLSYNGADVIFSKYNERFRELKKLTTVHLLNSKRVESLAPILNEEISTLLNNISILSCASKAVNLSELTVNFASSNICRMAFSKRYEDGSGSRFHSLLKETQALVKTFFFSDYFPLIGWLNKLCGQCSRLERVFKAWEAFYEELINEHLDPNRPKSEQEDVLDVLLRLRKEGSSTFDLSFDHIKGLLMNIFIAGTETSTATIIWAMTELIKNPMTMKKVQEELRNRTPQKDSIVWEDLQNLEYFKAVVKETFRLYPAAPLLVGHETIRESKVEGYDILPNTVVYVNAWAIGRDPETWKDPDMFKPERFLGSSIDLQGQNFELIPFGSGRRMCPGLHLGLVSTELTLANMLFSFDWELPAGIKKEDVDTDSITGILMQKKNPLCLIARKFPGF